MNVYYFCRYDESVYSERSTSLRLMLLLLLLTLPFIFFCSYRRCKYFEGISLYAILTSLENLRPLRWNRETHIKKLIYLSMKGEKMHTEKKTNFNRRMVWNVK